MNTSAASRWCLKGMIAISMLRFPKGTKGSEIDAFARSALWSAGLDYAHGTGHGVGSYLSVHEGPQRIAKVGVTPLEPGMILSNEPGYYKAGEYGIRIENLIIVTEPEAIERGDIEMMAFETLTPRPHRPPPDRYKPAHPRRTSMAGCLPRPRAYRDWPDGR